MKINLFFTCIDPYQKGHADRPAPRQETQANIEELDYCPVCHANISPDLLSSVYYRAKDSEQSNIASPQYIGVCLYRCPQCFNAFLVQYLFPDSAPVSIAPTRHIERSFSEHIRQCSPQFVSTYNQASTAEALGLSDICGLGYRRSLEFLIKDYLISLSQEDAEQIRRMPLGQCIQTRVDNDKLKAVASRAVWLGNDFAHYERRFNNLDLSDMKRFINATLAWVELELTTAEALAIPPAR